MAFKKYDIRDKVNILITVSDYISPMSEVRQVETIINDLDTSMIESTYSPYGQRAYHPKQLLSIIFYGYMKGIRSGRKLSTACKENINFIYLSRGHQISKSTFNDFRAKHYRHFSSLFILIVKKSIMLGLCDASVSVVDGSKILSNSSKKRSKNFEKYEKWYTTLLEDIEKLEEELACDETINNATEEELFKISSQINTKKQLLEKVEQQIKEFQSACDSDKYSDSITSKISLDDTINLTDSDAPIMKGKKGDFNTYYNTQIGCCENQIITFNDVVQDGNDKKQLIPCLEGITKNTGQPIQKALADADYGNLASFEFMEQYNIDGYVPFRNMNTIYQEQPFHATNFIYNSDTDTYTCPKDKTLTFYGKKHDTKRNHTFKKYRTPKLNTCQCCPFREQCVGKKGARRVILREIREHLREQMKQKLNTEEGKVIYNRRLHPVEAIFGNLKFNLGYHQFLLRGLNKVKAEFNIICSAFNLMKIIKLTSKYANMKHFYQSIDRLETHLFYKSILYQFISNMSMNFCEIFSFYKYVITYPKKINTLKLIHSRSTYMAMNGFL